MGCWVLAMSLAGGLKVGDRVSCLGRLGTVVGGPARAACIRLSVAVRYDDGRIMDERVANIELQVDVEEEEMTPARQPEPMVPPLALGAENEQQMASQSMWGQPVPQEAQAPPALDPRDLTPQYENGDTMRPDMR